jgi:hypothetical protein
MRGTTHTTSAKARRLTGGVLCVDEVLGPDERRLAISACKPHLAGFIRAEDENRSRPVRPGHRPVDPVRHLRYRTAARQSSRSRRDGALVGASFDAELPDVGKRRGAAWGGFPLCRVLGVEILTCDGPRAAAWPARWSGMNCPAAGRRQGDAMTVMLRGRAAGRGRPGKGSARGGAVAVVVTLSCAGLLAGGGVASAVAGARRRGGGRGADPLG